jgi:hypothetical protein
MRHPTSERYATLVLVPSASAKRENERLGAGIEEFNRQ